ncbi:SDR family oxidoreductase [Tetragenococcus halophilus]|uniref:SDR family oxidoreductase n=1 Tax=Tetragenococcus halophilus TaxID=51669 RepID=UPI001F223456|nr:SDR family oxidoreductase [Tetragenococcus halophilus]MCF1675284.1 SDR family oxidoreductase [Tetragenococcus halophilus]MDN6580458.1 SDR family oxidoreductase [Tetragenococcus koreensis]MDN6751501.1 SDR family oxidoreductase [Staphylococcus equorum]
MKTIFITGASSGIGKETAKYFSNHGWQVIATMRNLDKGKDLSELSNVVTMPLDVTNPKQIQDTCQEAMKRYDIDVLFNNAGYGLMAPIERIEKRQIEQLFNTDVFGTMLVTQEFIPHFKKRQKGTILTTTSLAGIIALPLDGVYGAAKRALTSMCESLYYELKPFGITVKVMLPGGTNTPFLESADADVSGYETASANQRKWLLNGNSQFPSPDQAAEVIYMAATDGKDKIHYPTDSASQKLYNQYMDSNIEDFKIDFYNMLFET